MANRVIRDSIWNSPSLARLSREADFGFPRWVLMADDWGCFNADPDVIKGTAYPKRRDVKVEEVEGWMVEYYNNGQLFLWMEGDRIWGFFTAFQENNTYLQRTTLADNGRQVKPRRRSPEPPKEALSAYLTTRKEIAGIKDIIGQFRTSTGTCLESVSVFVSKSESESESKIQRRGARKTAPPPPGFNELVGKIQKAWSAKYGANLNWNGKDGATLKALVSRNEEALVLMGWQLYLDDPDDYCQKNGQSFLNFASMFDKVVSRLAQKKKDQEWLEGKTG